MNNIHKTAIVSKDAILGENVTIGAYSVIGDNVKTVSYTHLTLPTIYSV